MRVGGTIINFTFASRLYRPMRIKGRPEVNVAQDYCVYGTLIIHEELIDY